MSNPISFVNQYVSNITILIGTLEALRVNNDEITQDPTLLERYFSMTPTPPGTFPGQAVRGDITQDDVLAAQAALVQVLFAYDTGAPPQKAALYKMRD